MPEVKVHSLDGAIHDYAWAQEVWGVEIVERLDGEFRAVEFYEVESLPLVEITIRDKAGPVRGERAVLSWPDAPPAPGAGWEEKGLLSNPSNANGVCSHVYGSGADCSHGVAGPHSLWLFGPDKSDYIEGLGMWRHMGYRHLDIVFERREEEPPGPPEPPEPPEPPGDLWAMLLDSLDRIGDLVERLAVKLDA